MINLNEIANKISEVLNSIDNPLRIDNQRVLFEVATEGYRVDTIANKQQGKNMIPVYLQLAGGENQPIPGLGQQSKTISIGVYYPVKYKEIFFHLEDYLGTVFIGKKLNFGELTGVCLCNLGVAQYGSIEGMDVNNYKSFIAATKYEKTIESSGNWISLGIQLFLTKTASGFLFGNDVEYSIELKYKDISITGLRLYDDGNNTLYSYSSADNVTIDSKTWLCFKHGNDKVYSPTPINLILKKCDYLGMNVELYQYVNSEMQLIDSADYVIVETIYSVSSSEKVINEKVVWSNSGTGANISPIAEQRIGLDEFAKNVTNITNFNKSILVFLKPTTELGAVLITLYNLQRLDIVKSLKLIKRYSNGWKYNFKQLILSANENAELGMPLSFTYTFGDEK